MDFNVVTFFEKKGCATNAKQKKVLRSLGLVLHEEDLLTYPFTKESLLGFLQERPVADWFNPNAPKIKSGELSPERYSPDAAIRLLLNEPLLIRRPLLAVRGKKFAGFDMRSIQELLGAELLPSGEDLHSCSHGSGI